MASESLLDLFFGCKVKSIAGWKIILDSKIYSRDEFTGQIDITPHFHTHNPKNICLKTKLLNFDSEALWAV